MKKNNKKIIISIFVFFIIVLLSISIIIANNTASKTNIEVDKEKIYYEIKYLDSQIVSMMNLLNNTRKDVNFYIDWQELQTQTQNMYNYWNSTILDFNNLNLDKNYLTDFGKDLDNLTISIKNNNKEDTINNLLNLYNKLVLYSEELNNRDYYELLITKINLLTAYSIAENENWTLTHEYILKSSESISNVVNSIENNEYNQYNINQAYIAIKELENLINIKDLDVFYLKYNNAMEKIKTIKIGEV